MLNSRVGLPAAHTDEVVKIAVRQSLDIKIDRRDVRFPATEDGQSPAGNLGVISQCSCWSQNEHREKRQARTHPRQRELVKQLATGQSQKSAAIKAGYSPKAADQSAYQAI